MLYFVLYFLYIQLVILTPLLFKLAKSSWRWVGWCITPASLLLFKYTGWYSDVAINDNLLFISSFSCPVWFIFYYMGISVRGREESICKKHCHPINLVCIEDLGTTTAFLRHFRTSWYKHTSMFRPLLQPCTNRLFQSITTQR